MDMEQTGKAYTQGPRVEKEFTGPPPRAWTNLERAADRLKSAKDDFERWTVTLETVAAAQGNARRALKSAEADLSTIALSETANKPEQ